MSFDSTSFRITLLNLLGDPRLESILNVARFSDDLLQIIAAWLL